VRGLAMQLGLTGWLSPASPGRSRYLLRVSSKVQMRHPVFAACDTNWRDLCTADRSGNQDAAGSTAFTALRYMPMTNGARYWLEIGATG